MLYAVIINRWTHVIPLSLYFPYLRTWACWVFGHGNTTSLSANEAPTIRAVSGFLHGLSDIISTKISHWLNNIIAIGMVLTVQFVSVVVGIQTATLLVTLWISYGHPVRIKRAGYLFKFHFSITLAVIWISRTVAGSNNWMLSKESLRVSSHSILSTLDQR